MELQKINVKFFAENSSAVPPETFIHVFNSWIQAAEGAYYDVADYSHVPSGPGILLVAHEANISLDNSDNRLGLLYGRKQPLEGSNRERLRLVFNSALEYCRRMEKDPLLGGKLRFLGNEALFLINDRLIAPNNKETFQAVKPDLEDMARELYGGAQFELKPERDPRRRFGVRIQTPVSISVEALLKNLSN